MAQMQEIPCDLRIVNAAHEHYEFVPTPMQAALLRMRNIQRIDVFVGWNSDLCHRFWIAKAYDDKNKARYEHAGSIHEDRFKVARALIESIYR